MKSRALALAMAACACGLPLAADAAKPPVQGQPSLTIAARPPAVTYGGAVVVSGTRRGPNHGHRPVALQANPYPFPGFKDVAHTTTDSKGAYRVRVRGDADHSTGTSGRRLIRVH